MYGDEHFHRPALSLTATQFHKRKFKSEWRKCIFQHVTLHCSESFQHVTYVCHATITTIIAS